MQQFWLRFSLICCWTLIIINIIIISMAHGPIFSGLWAPDPEFLSPESMGPEFLDPDFLDPELMGEILGPAALGPDSLGPEALGPDSLCWTLFPTTCPAMPGNALQQLRPTPRTGAVQVLMPGSEPRQPETEAGSWKFSKEPLQSRRPWWSSSEPSRRQASIQATGVNNKKTHCEEALPIGGELLGGVLKTPRAWTALCVCIHVSIIHFLRGLIGLLGTPGGSWGRGDQSPRRGRPQHRQKNKGGKREVWEP